MPAPLTTHSCVAMPAGNSAPVSIPWGTTENVNEATFDAGESLPRFECTLTALVAVRVNPCSVATF